MVVVPLRDGAEVGSNSPSHSLSCSLKKPSHSHVPCIPGAAFPVQRVGIRVGRHPLSPARARRRIAASAR